MFLMLYFFMWLWLFKEMLLHVKLLVTVYMLLFQQREKKTVRIQADDPISFLQLVSKADLGGGENMFDLTLSQALGQSAKKETDPMASSKLNKVKMD